MSSVWKFTSELQSVGKKELRQLRCLFNRSGPLKCASAIHIFEKCLELTNLESKDPIARIKKAIQSGSDKDIVQLKNVDDCDALFETYTEKKRLLVVNLSSNVFVIKDKNNYRIITSVLKTASTNTPVIERRFTFPPKEHAFTQSVIDADVLGITSKVLPQRSRRTTTKVPPIPNHESIVFPFTNTQYDFTANSSDDRNIKYSIEATDGASSMASVAGFVSSAESRFNPRGMINSTESFASNVGSHYRPRIAATTNNTKCPLPKRPPRPLARYREYENVPARKKTFEASNWENYPNRPMVDTLVEWGFYYTGQLDLVRCFHCGIGLKDWSIEDDARDEHVRHSADCDFLKETLGQDNLNRLKIHILYEADGGSVPQFAYRQYGPGAFAASSLTRSDQIATSSMRLQAPSVSPKNGVNKNAAPQLAYSVRHPKYQTVESRKLTYNNFPHNKQDARKLAIAGFYFTGQGDECRCFCCDGGMQHWEEDDDPLREHAKYFPKCGYIRQMKGDEYVRLQAGMKEEVATTSQDHQRVDNKDTDMEKKGGSGQTQSDKIDVYRSKVVQNVLASGFDKNQVKSAVDSLLNRGLKQFTEDDIVNMILDDPEPENKLGLDTSVADTEVILQENKMLKDFLKCMLCKHEEANVLFLPCAHHKVCMKCSENLKNCSFCSETISKKIKTFMS